ncbi:hypothetical protein CR513_14209, partial [Mucuna pruriens]
MILVEIGEPSPRTALFEPAVNEEELRANLDLLQEIREITHIKEYAAKARVARKYDISFMNKLNEESYEGNYLMKLQDPKRTAIETDLGSEEMKLQDPKRMAIKTDPGSEEMKTTTNGREKPAK